jgi:short-subunit dehydrogenase
MMRAQRSGKIVNVSSIAGRHQHRVGQIALDTLFQTSGHTAYAPQAADKRALFLSVAESGSDPDVVAQAILKAVAARRPKTRYGVGAFAKPSIFMSTFLPDRFTDWMVSLVTRRFARRQAAVRPA